ncbi:hypothetical protein CF328_g9542 [Tilletia controversa]|nr:hypothetical protein CF328_g9542 [Tilletia controversa]
MRDRRRDMGTHSSSSTLLARTVSQKVSYTPVSTAGYLLDTALTVKHVFDVHEDDRFACMADVGWITGHSYISTAFS